MIFKFDNHLCSASRLLFACAFLASVSFVAAPVLAQDQDVVESVQAEDVMNGTSVLPGQSPEDKEIMMLESLRGLPYLTIEDTLRHKRELLGAVEPLNPDVSLMFSSWEHALLREMKNQDAVARPATQGELDAASRSDKPRVRGLSELSLGGIVYASEDEWTIWLNNQRVTPDAIPKEVLDMRVTNEYVEIKWFDAYSNLVYPLRLRPHQRFNLDNRIFLPGTTAGAL